MGKFCTDCTYQESTSGAGTMLITGTNYDMMHREDHPKVEKTRMALNSSAALLYQLPGTGTM